MASRRGIRRTLVWSLIALYAAIMVPGQALHAFSACRHRIVEPGTVGPHADDRTASVLATPHDEGSCALCTCLSQTPFQTPNQGPVLRSPTLEVHLDGTPVRRVLRPRSDGDPRAPPQKFPI